MELEVVGPQHPTYVPLSGNRCWALIPTDLDWYCYSVDVPNWLRILRRIGLYLQAGGKRGPVARVLENLKTFYGANYLRLTGVVEGVDFEIEVFPDAEESILYLVVEARNSTSRRVDVKIMTAADFEFHPAPWACKGFTEDATQDYSGLGRKVNAPRDDGIKVQNDGSIFFVSDGRNPGVGFLGTEKPSGWTLDRGRFSFETPMSGYRPNRGDAGDDVLDLSNEANSEDGLCVVQHDLSLQPAEKQTVPTVIGYQSQESPEAILDALRGSDEALERTKAFYQTPLRKGIKVETPDPIINAQFNLFNVFVKMNEHRSGTKCGFLPAVHYYNWLCGDFFFTLLGYAYTNDLDPLVDSMDLFRKCQHEDGFIPNLPLWTEGPSWRERSVLPIGETLGYIVAACHLIKFMRDRRFAADVFPSLKKAMSAALANEQAGLIVPGGEFAFDALDWPCGFAHCPQTFISLLTYKCLTDLAALSDWLSQAEYAGTLRTKAKTLKGMINEKLWMEDRGHYRIGLPTASVGRDERDERLFQEEIISWSSLVAVLWGVAEGERGERAIRSVKERLYSPYGLKFLDPPWSPAYTDVKGAATYEAGRVQNGAYWQTWWSIENLVRAEIMLGRVEEAFRDFLDLRLDATYSRFKLREKGKDLSFIRAGEWTDTDLTFPVTSIPYTLTAAFFNQTLVEAILGIEVGYDDLRIDPHLPASWHGAKVSNLTIGDSEWTIAIQRRGKITKILLDGAQTSSATIPITGGKHHVEITLAPCED